MIRNLSPVIVLNVTRYTRCAQPGELADRTCFMTRLTIDASVRAHQREPVLVPLYGLQGDIPTSDRMAFFAFSTKLAAMYVCMAVGALHPHVRKNEVCMTRAGTKPSCIPRRGERVSLWLKSGWGRMGSS